MRASAKALHESTSQSPPSTYSSFSTPRPPSYSACSISYPFTSNPFLRETYRSPWDEVRVGKILEDLDACAGNICFKHAVMGGDWDAPLIVTAGIDRVRVMKRPTVDEDMVLEGSISWVGSSSMEITMRVTGEVVGTWLEAAFTFVARDASTNKATKIVSLDPSTPSEKDMFERGKSRAETKKRVRKMAASQSAYTLEVERKAREALNGAMSMQKMPSLAPPDQVLMSQTELHNAFTAQPQQRNMHNRIFGGFLMRRAFELAFATAYNFGGCKPRFVEVDDISFLTPVDVGDLLVYHSRVIYTLPDGGDLNLDGGTNPLVMVEVDAFVQEPDVYESHLSNKFHFTFSLPGQNTCKRIVPDNMDDAKRQIKRMIEDERQAGVIE
ncbi:hypothetical protein TrRE_jg4499 [Triparma retinervis]|uniref:HotDog ACOT-type domain-containing protein n=1 Tax=Triparma retinervis TaxID=2557542 RepID=A0A9W7FBB8_9STRA|nr:hypothetical protein TrRE_jg4499 [Triparma retinervis]